MHLTDQVMAQKEHMLKFIQEYPSNTPVCMLNILKFKEDLKDGKERSKASYDLYSLHVAPLLESAGGRVLWAGEVAHTIVGDLNQQPDRILVVYYPSKEAFLNMVTSEAYAKISHYREVALEYGGLIANSSLRFKKSAQT
jgi:uncharacterized protein (DUF1330 family)